MTNLEGVTADLRAALSEIRWRMAVTPIPSQRYDRLMDAESYIEDAIREVEKADTDD